MLTKLFSSPMFTRTFYDDPPPVVEEKTFKQADLDRLVADARRKDQEQIKKTVGELTKVQQAVGLTQKERDDLQSQITELTSTYTTKEQLAAQKLEQEQSKWKTDLDVTVKERDRWRQSFEETTIETGIVRTAAQDAINIEVLQDLLKPKSRLVEGRNADGTPNGVFTVMAKVTITDKKEKKPIVLDLPIDEAIKQMKDDVPRYGNLFKSTAAAGLGGSGGGKGAVGQTGPVSGEDITNMTDAQYAEMRKSRGMARKG